MIQPPCDIHRLFALVLNIFCRTEKGIGFRTVGDPVCLKLTDEQQHAAAFLTVMDIPLTGIQNLL